MVETSEDGKRPIETGDAVAPGSAPPCGPGCGCGKPAGTRAKGLKIAVCLVVVIAACGIILYKTTSAKSNATDCGNRGFSNPLFDTPAATASSVGQQAGSVASISAMSAIDTVAANLDTVFLMIPTKDNAPATKETGAAVAAVERILKAKGIRTGIFTLQADSSDYPGIAAKVSVPGIVVLTKGRANSVVTGGISEESVMQAYVASTRRASCCPPGAPPCK